MQSIYDVAFQAPNSSPINSYELEATWKHFSKQLELNQAILED